MPSKVAAVVATAESAVAVSNSSVRQQPEETAWTSGRTAAAAAATVGKPIERKVDSPL